MTPARRYHAVATQTASRERLLILLLHAAQSSMEQARALLGREPTATAITHLDKAMAIVQELDATLDHSQGRHITGPLSDVYAFVVWRLIQAKNRLQSTPVEEALRAFGPIVEAFDAAIGIGATEAAHERR
jgi:flagellar biosynthetic protein FliS